MISGSGDNTLLSFVLLSLLY